MRKKTVLIIDDENECREILRESLEGQYNILEASNGLRGVELLKTEAVDLIISDLKMPVQDGVDTILEVRHSKPRVKIIVVSGYESDIQKARMFRADRTFSKPFDIVELTNEVRKLIG